MPAELKLIPLLDYFRQRGCLAEPQARAEIMDEIAAGKVKAHILATPKPSGGSWQSLVRDEARGAYGPKLVSAMSVTEVRVQIEKAAMALDVDWTFLKRLLIDARVESANEQSEPQQPEPISDEAMDRLKNSVQWPRAQTILRTIADLGLDAFALQRPERNGGGGDRAKVRAAISERDIRKTDFKNAWDFVLNNKLASYRIG